MVTKYAIVCFPKEEDALGIIPEKWCLNDGRQCYWPTYATQSRLTKAIKEAEEPQPLDWKKHKIRILKVKDSYEKAVDLMDLARETSDLKTEYESVKRKGKRRPKKEYDVASDGYSESDEDGAPRKSKKMAKVPPLPTIADFSKPTVSGNLVGEAEADTAVASRRVTSIATDVSPKETPKCSRSVELTPTTSYGTSSELLDSHGQTVTETPKHSRSVDLAASHTTDSKPATSSGTRSNSHVGRHVTETPRSSRSVDYTAPDTSNSPATSSGTRSNTGLPASLDGQHVTETEKVIIKMLAELQAAVGELSYRVTTNTKLLQNLQLGATLEEDYMLPEGVVLPADTKEQLQLLENAIEGDKDFQRYLITTLAARGGHSVQDCIKRMMVELLSNSMMQQLNWTGQGQKGEFRKLRIHKILKKAIRRNTFTKGTTDAEIQIQVAKHLKGSTDRGGGRKKRQKPKPQTPDDVDSDSDDAVVES